MITDPADLNETEPQTVGVGELESSFKNLPENNVKSVIRGLSSNKAPEMGGEVRSEKEGVIGIFGFAVFAIF